MTSDIELARHAVEILQAENKYPKKFQERYKYLFDELWNFELSCRLNYGTNEYKAVKALQYRNALKKCLDLIYKHEQEK